MAAVLATLRRLVSREDATMADTEQQDFLRQAAEFDPELIEAYELAERYYDGKHNVRLVDRAKLFLQAHGFEFAENFCETIIDILVEHTSVEAFSVTDNEDASSWLTEEWWPAAGMDETQGTVHHNSYLKGDAYLIFEVDEHGMPQPCWNDPSQVKVVYDDDNETPLYAVKKWRSRRASPTNENAAAITRLNLYWPDRIEQWFCLGEAGSGSMWAPHLDESDIQPVTETDEAGDEADVLDEHGGQQLVERWPIWWTEDGTPTGAPLGVNCMHFRNKARGKANGRSELHGVYSQQNMLNKLCVDLFYVMDAQGWPQRWGVGIDEDANIKVAIGEILRATKPEAKFGQFDPADPGPILAAMDKTLIRMAARARIPLHMLMLGGDLPSGESLKTAYTPLVKKTEDREVSTGRTWQRTATMALRLHSVFATPGFSWDPETERVDVVWESPQPRNETDDVTNALGKQEIGVSEATTLRELGYDPDEEAKLRDQEAKAAMARAPKLPPPSGGLPADPPAPVDEQPPAAA